MKALRLAFSAILFSLLLLGSRALVWEQYRANTLLGGLQFELNRVSLPPHRIRSFLEMLSVGSWDPYLSGTRDLYRARAFAKLGLVEQARSAYERSLTERVLPEVIVEFALYNWETGSFGQARASLIYAGRFSPVLIRRIPDRELRREISELAGREVSEAGR